MAGRCCHFLHLFGAFANAGTVNYTYDDAGRLIQVEYENGKVITYTYDKAGNLLQRQVTGGIQQYTLTVIKDGTLQFSAATYSKNEDGGTATITVTRMGGTDGTVSVEYATSDNTATAGNDYTAATGTLNWADGDGTDKTFTVSITDDILLESNETINLALGNPAGGASLGTPNTALLTIVDNEIDTDLDGVSDAMENGGPNGGDGDDNGTPDASEANVSTLLSHSGNYCTVVSPAGTQLLNVTCQGLPNRVHFTDGCRGLYFRSLRCKQSFRYTRDC